jgi:hypothetical protein
MTTHVVLHHRIKNTQAAFSRGENLLEGKDAPPGVRVVQFYPSQDQTAVTCLREADSVETVRQYVDSTLGAVAGGGCRGEPARRRGVRPHRPRGRRLGRVQEDQ